jgi:hypothetical protein
MNTEAILPYDADQAHGSVQPNDMLYAPRPGLRPYRQGDLDALCGLYAIINAARWAIWPREMTPDFAETLFAKLGHHAAMALRMPALCAMGVTVPQLRALSRIALAMIHAECGVTLQLHTIPAKALRITPDHQDAPGVVATSRLGEAFIVHITNGIGHWTVFERIEGRRVRFFDSAGWHSIALSKAGFSSAFRFSVMATRNQNGPPHGKTRS